MYAAMYTVKHRGKNKRHIREDILTNMYADMHTVKRRGQNKRQAREDTLTNIHICGHAYCKAQRGTQKTH